MSSEKTCSCIEMLEDLLFMLFSEEAEVHVGGLQIFCGLYPRASDEAGMKGVVYRVYKNLPEYVFQKA